MNTLYDLAARVSLDTTGFAGAASMAMSVFARLHQQAGLTTAQVGKLSAAFKMFAAGAVITGVGVGLVGFMDKAVQRAMDLQTIMVGIQQRTGAALIDPRTQGFTGQGQQLQRLFENIGLTNQMSTGDVAGVAQAASRAGITQMSQLTQMLKPLANYSEIMLRATGADTGTSAKIATEFAHLYGAFGDRKIGGVSDTQYLVNQLGKAMQVVPISQEQFLRLMSQFVGTERPLYKGKPAQSLISDTITEGVLMAQMGQGSRGGNQIARIITSMMGGARGTTALRALAGIQRGTGIHFANAQGQINDPSMLLKALATTAQKLSPADTLKIFTQAFQQNGARLAGLFSDPIVGARLTQIAAAMKAMPNLDAQQRAYNASPAGQFNQARKNFDSAMTTLGILWLPLATRAANAFAAFTAGIVRFTQQNPRLMQFLATIVAVTAAVALVVGPFLMLAGIIGMLAAVGLPAIVAALVPLAVALGAFLAIVAVVTLAVTLWGKQIKALGDLMGTALGKEFSDLGAWIHNVILPAFARLGAAINYVVNLIPHPHGNGYTAGQGDTPPPGVHAPHAGDVYRDGHWYQLRDSARGSHYVLDDPKGKGGGGYVLNVAPGAIVVNPHPHQSPDEIAAYTVRALGDHLLHEIGGGSPWAKGMTPSLNAPPG